MPSVGDATIVAFESPHRLVPMTSVPTSDADGGGNYAVRQQQFKIRFAASESRKESASLLIRKRYAWRGYANSVKLDDSPNRITVLASAHDHLAGTMTLCLDSDLGLPADEVYKDKLDALRARGLRLAEPSNLAIDDKIKEKRVFASIIHLSFIYAYVIHGYTEYVIEINPRHMAFYERMLGFTQIGEERICKRVNAPAVLMHLPLQVMRENIDRYGGMGEAARGVRSLYPYFFSPQDELGITRRLQGE